jgi:multidrug efflux pump subunit AcrB
MSLPDNTAQQTPGHGLIHTFVHHKVAANILMAVLLVAGIFALSKLNVQFFPTFSMDMATVRVEWRGAAAEDVEDGITSPLEQRLKSVANLDKITSTASQGIASITLEFKEGTDPIVAVDDVKQLVSEFRNLPKDAETPEVSRIARYESIARLLITGGNLDELRRLARRFEQELVARGVDKVDMLGLPQDEIAIDIPARELERLNLTLDQAATRIGALSQDSSAGTVGEGEIEREIRAIQQRRDPRDFRNLPLVTEGGARVELAQVASIQRQGRDGSLHIFVGGKPAVELLLKRAEDGHSLKAAKVFKAWLEDTRPTLPKGVEIEVYDEQWSLIEDRISLLVKNGLGGLLIVVAILYMFLNGRVAFWVAMGIPTAFMATLAVLWLMGGSINMISLFALIMALGIIVDDAIVVGEDAYAHHRMGEAPTRASEGGAKRMFWPVLASSLTTVAAFLPLMMISGPMGKIMYDIPFVMICVLMASLLECFLILPAHLRNAFVHDPTSLTHGLRQRLEAGFDRFRDHIFRPLVTRAVDWRGATLAAGLMFMILVVGLLAGGRVKFTFFPTPEGQIVYANATFVSGTPAKEVELFLRHLETSLAETEKALGEKVVQHAVSRQGAVSGEAGSSRQGDQFGSVTVQLSPSEDRATRTEAFVQAWQARVKRAPGMESLVLTERKGGPPGSDIQVRFTGPDEHALKLAALELQTALRQIPGVYGIEDDMPYGREQLIFRPTPQGEALGLTVNELSSQLRAAFDGRLVQIFQDGPDEVEVRVRYPKEERTSLADLGRMNVRTPGGLWVPLATVASWSTRQGFEALRHAETQLAVEVTAAVNAGQNNLNDILAGLTSTTLPPILEKYGVQYSFEGRAADQRETMADMKTGLVIGLVLIFLILAWVFAHYGWPIIIMLSIPFGLVGAILGHWLMGINLTILSMFGLFGLSGIVVNDSIVLFSFYKELRAQGMPANQAVIEAACLRLRAILLTSLTTIGGLAPLMLETSLQAQFLIPMATSISFGLMVTTVVALLWLPAMLSVYESFHARLERTWPRLFAGAT